MILVTLLILVGALMIYAGIKKENPLTIVKGVVTP